MEPRTIVYLCIATITVGGFIFFLLAGRHDFKNMMAAQYPEEFPEAVDWIYLEVEAEVEKIFMETGIIGRISASESAEVTKRIHAFIHRHKEESYKHGMTIHSEQPPVPVGRCKYDDNGEGNCTHCLDNPSGCYFKSK